MPSLSNVRLPSAFKYNFDVRIKGSGHLFYPSSLDIGALARFFSCIVLSSKQQLGQIWQLTTLIEKAHSNPILGLFVLLPDESLCFFGP